TRQSSRRPTAARPATRWCLQNPVASGNSVEITRGRSSDLPFSTLPQLSLLKKHLHAYESQKHGEPLAQRRPGDLLCPSSADPSSDQHSHDDERRHFQVYMSLLVV